MKRSREDQVPTPRTSATGRLIWGGDGRVRVHPLVETLPADLRPGQRCSDALAARLRRDGYLFVRGLFSREAVLDARAAILDAVSTSAVARSRDASTDRAAAAGDARDTVADTPMSLLGRQDIAALPAVTHILESPTVAALLQRSTGAPPGTEFHPVSAVLSLSGQLQHSETRAAVLSRHQVPYKWLRAVGPGLFTGVHMDRVYFPDIDPLTHTCWIPLGDVPVGNGAMMICEGAHAHGDRRFTTLREHYLLERKRSGTREGRQNGTDSGWYTSDAAEICREFGSDVRWLTADMSAGDAVILPLETLHCTAANTEAKRHRISCDVRWVPLRRSRSDGDEDRGIDSESAAQSTQRGRSQQRQRT